MKTIFLDCGSNIGQGFQRCCKQLQLNNILDEVHMFEPILSLCEILKNSYPNYHIHHNAVWNKNETRILNIEMSMIDGTNIIAGHRTNILQENYKKSQYSKAEWMLEWPPKFSDHIECLNFSEFIKINFNKDDIIYLKMDIEGAEYEVFDKMIEDQTLSYIKYLMVEWHDHQRKDKVKDINYYYNEFKKYNINIVYIDPDLT